MKGMKLAKNATLALACVGMLVPQTRLNAAPTTPSTNTAINHVALSQSGSFTGKVINSQGEALSETKVVISQDNQVIAETTTIEAGQFTFQNLKAGVYLVSTEQSQNLYHIWPNKVAPPAAGKQALIVSDHSTMRGAGPFGLFGNSGGGGGAGFGGMGGFLGLAGLAVGITGVAIGVEAQQDVNDLQDQIDQAQASP